MRFRLLAAVGAALALVSTPTVASASTGGPAGAGLWSADHTATITDCGRFSRDDNQFCYADDPGAVELGVRFTTSVPVLASGVRIYRVDAGPVSGSLWATEGTLLATGAFAAYAGAHGWQDLAFDTPVPLTPGVTYIASYFAPNASYGFEYYTFRDSALTVGPITALQSVAGSGNGVFCYDSATCFPGETYRDSNYWVSPLWAYDFDGFYQPVDNDKLNVVKAGRAIPVKFSLGGDYGLDILRDGYPKATRIACDSSDERDAIEETETAGSSSLSYDADADQYVYVWKTSKAKAGKCFRFELGLSDGTSHTFDVKLRR